MVAEQREQGAQKQSERWLSLRPPYSRILIYYLIIGVVAWPAAELIAALANYLLLEEFFYLAAALCLVLMVAETRIDYPKGKRVPYNILGTFTFASILFAKLLNDAFLERLLLYLEG